MKPIILLIGNNEVAKKEYLNSVLSNVQSENIYNFYIDDTEPSIIFSYCYQNSLFGDRNYVIIKNFDNSSDIKKEKFLESLENYINNYNSDNTLIILTEKIKEKIQNKIEEIGYVKEFKRFYKNDLINYIVNKLRTFNISFENEIPEYIIFLANEDNEIIESNLNIVIQYALEAKKISLEEVQCLLSHSGNRNIFDLINGIFNKNISLSINSLSDLKLSVDSITYITNMIYRSAKLLWIYLSSQKKEESLKEIGIKYYELKKLGEYSKNIDLKFLSKLFETLSSIETITKTMSEEFAYLELEKFILNMK